VLAGEAGEAGSRAGSTPAGQEISQRIGSEVLLYTEGDTAMDFRLSFPPRDDLGCDIQEYITRTATTVRLSQGTLLIFKAEDDEFFCHEAAFRASSLPNNPQGHRFCFVFRWLTVSSWFATGPSFAYQGPHNPALPLSQASALDLPGYAASTSTALSTAGADAGTPSPTPSEISYDALLAADAAEVEPATPPEGSGATGPSS